MRLRAKKSNNQKLTFRSSKLNVRWPRRSRYPSATMKFLSTFICDFVRILTKLHLEGALSYFPIHPITCDFELKIRWDRNSLFGVQSSECDDLVAAAAAFNASQMSCEGLRPHSHFAVSMERGKYTGSCRLSGVKRRCPGSGFIHLHIHEKRRNCRKCTCQRSEWLEHKKIEWLHIHTVWQGRHSGFRGLRCEQNELSYKFVSEIQSALYIVIYPATTPTPDKSKQKGATSENLLCSNLCCNFSEYFRTDGYVALAIQNTWKPQGSKSWSFFPFFLRCCSFHSSARLFPSVSSQILVWSCLSSYCHVVRSRWLEQRGHYQTNKTAQTNNINDGTSSITQTSHMNTSMNWPWDARMTRGLKAAGGAEYSLVFMREPWKVCSSRTCQ